MSTTQADRAFSYSPPPAQAQRLAHLADARAGHEQVNGKAFNKQGEKGLRLCPRRGSDPSPAHLERSSTANKVLITQVARCERLALQELSKLPNGKMATEFAGISEREFQHVQGRR